MIDRCSVSQWGTYYTTITVHLEYKNICAKYVLKDTYVHNMLSKNKKKLKTARRHHVLNQCFLPIVEVLLRLSQLCQYSWPAQFLPWLREELLRNSARFQSVVPICHLLKCNFFSSQELQPLIWVFSSMHWLFLVLWQALGMIPGSMTSIGNPPLFYNGCWESFMGFLGWDPAP